MINFNEKTFVFAFLSMTQRQNDGVASTILTSVGGGGGGQWIFRSVNLITCGWPRIGQPAHFYPSDILYKNEYSRI